METLPRHRFSSVQIKAVKPIISGVEADAEVLGADITFHVDGIAFKDAVHLARQVDLKLPVDITVATVQGELPVEIDGEGNVTVVQEPGPDDDQFTLPEVTNETASDTVGDDAQEPETEDDSKSEGEGEGEQAARTEDTGRPGSDGGDTDASPIVSDGEAHEAEVGSDAWPPMATLVENLAKAYIASDKNDAMLESQFDSSVKEAAWHYGVEEKVFRRQIGDVIGALEEGRKAEKTTKGVVLVPETVEETQTPPAVEKSPLLELVDKYLAVNDAEKGMAIVQQVVALPDIENPINQFLVEVFRKHPEPDSEFPLMLDKPEIHLGMVGVQVEPREGDEGPPKFLYISPRWFQGEYFEGDDNEEQGDKSVLITYSAGDGESGESPVSRQTYNHLKNGIRAYQEATGGAPSLSSEESSSEETESAPPVKTGPPNARKRRSRAAATSS